MFKNPGTFLTKIFIVVSSFIMQLIIMTKVVIPVFVKVLMKIYFQANTSYLEDIENIE